MKRMDDKLTLTILALFFITTLQIRCQSAGLDFLYGGVADAEKLLQSYLEPFANILGSELNAGWYHTARPHQLGGVDITATVSWAKAPAALFTYEPAALGLNGKLESTGSSLAPTVVGEMEERPEIYYSQPVEFPDGSIQETEYARYTLPNGAGVDFFPLPMLQLTVGLPFGTDISARFIPMIQMGDYGEIGLWGVGGKHSVSQWIPAINELEFLDISLQGGYTSVTSSANVDVEPLDMDNMVDPYPDFDWDDQYANQHVTGWTVNLIASQTLSVFTIFEGIGYASSLVELAMLGHYPVHTVISEGADIGKPTYEIVEDPFDFNYENINNLRINIGARIKLGVLTLHYDFTHTLYSTHSLGIGISFR